MIILKNFKYKKTLKIKNENLLFQSNYDDYTFDFNKKFYSFYSQNGGGKTTFKNNAILSLKEMQVERYRIYSLNLEYYWNKPKVFSENNIVIYDISVFLNKNYDVFFNHELSDSLRLYYQYINEMSEGLIKKKDLNSFKKHKFKINTKFLYNCFNEFIREDDLSGVIFKLILNFEAICLSEKKNINSILSLMIQGEVIKNDKVYVDFSLIPLAERKNIVMFFKGLNKEYLDDFNNNYDDFNIKLNATNINKYNIFLKKEFEKKDGVVNCFKDKFPIFSDLTLIKKNLYSLNTSFYDLSITVGGIYFENLKYFNAYASDGQKKLLGILNFVLDCKFQEGKKNKKKVFFADDLITSIDNSNSKAVYLFLRDFFVSDGIKNYCFFNFTNDFEIYRLFNNVFNLDRDFHQMLKIERNQDLVSFKDFPIKNNLYRDYLMMKPNKILNSSGNKVLNNDLSLNFIYFVSNISYYRNTVESYYSEKHPEYELATNFLHLKNTDITLKYLLDKDFFKSTPFGKSLKSIGNKKYWDLYKDIEIDISTKFKKQGHFNGLTYDSIEIKVFYSLFCRLYMEEQMFRYLLLIEPEKFKKDVAEITSNQTNALLEMFAEKEKSITFYPLRWKPEYEILSELLDCYLKVKNYISDYMHIQYNEVAYIINIKGDVLQNLVREMKEVTARADAAWNLAFSKPSTEDVKE